VNLDYNPGMTYRDVLMERVFGRDGTPPVASPWRKHDVGEDVWKVSAKGKPTQTLLPFEEVIDLAVRWAEETGGDIYRLDTLGGMPSLFRKALWPEPTEHK
jgi:hypothetical protein